MGQGGVSNELWGRGAWRGVGEMRTAATSTKRRWETGWIPLSAKLNAKKKTNVSASLLVIDMPRVRRCILALLCRVALLKLNKHAKQAGKRGGHNKPNCCYKLTSPKGKSYVGQTQCITCRFGRYKRGQSHRGARGEMGGHGAERRGEGCEEAESRGEQGTTGDVQV